MAQLICATLLLAHFAALTMLTPAFANPIHVPIVARKHDRVLDINKEAFRLRRRYGITNATYPPVRMSGTGRRATMEDFPLINQENDVRFVANIAVGTPPQPFTVILDTGSSDVVLFGDNCAPADLCPSNAPLFKPSLSSSFQAIGTGDIQLNFGIGSVAGGMGSDTVQMGGLKIDAQTLVNIDNVVANISINAASGILGLGLQGNAATHAVPFWQALIANNLLSAPEFGFYLRRAGKNAQDGSNTAGGVLTMGGTNVTLFSGDVDFVDMPVLTGPNAANRFWALSMTELSVNGNKIALSGNTAISAIDTGTSLIGGPTADVQAFWKGVSNSAPSPSGPGFFNFPCSQKLSVSMSFGGKSWPINSDDMVVTQEPNDNTRCIGAIFDLTAVSPAFATGEGDPSWLVGDTFLKNVYSVFRFDPPSIGFAELSPSAVESGADTTVTGSAPGTTSTTSPGQDGSLGTKKSAALTISAPTLLRAVVSLLISSATFNWL